MDLITSNIPTRPQHRMVESFTPGLEPNQSAKSFLPPLPSQSNPRRRASDSGPVAVMDARRAAMESQAVADAKLHSAFDATGGAQGGFDYKPATVEALRDTSAPAAAPQRTGAQAQGPTAKGSKSAAPPPNGAVAYAQKMQRGGLIQKFGCVLVLEEPTFRVLAYSENAPEMLGLLDTPEENTTPSQESVASVSSTAPQAERIPQPSVASKQVVVRGEDPFAGKDHLRRVNSVGAALLQIGARIRRALAMKSGQKSQRGPDLTASAAVHAQPARPQTAKSRHVPPLKFGACALPLFTADSAANLRQAALVPDLRILNPLLVQSVGATGEAHSFFAILHRTDTGLHLDLEPIRQEDMQFATGQGAMQAHRLASRSVARLDKVPAGNLPMLFDTVVREVRALTGYDRVMAYKFHEDYHGEVVAESRKETMQPMLGLHYPATDIPQFARLMFLKTQVRIIVDFKEKPVKVVQDERRVKQPVVLANSTLRAVHGCHAEYMKNMGMQASNVMAVVVNEHPSLATLPPALPGQDPGRRLWGLVVCHHETARFLPYPLRLACEFLMQVFSLRVNMEMEMEVLEKQKDALRVQAYLTDMLLRDPLHAIVSKKPNLMDLVPCDGAALLLRGSFFTLGHTPTQPQMLDLLQWVHAKSRGSVVFSTDSLKETGYPFSKLLREEACGLLAAPFGGGSSNGGCVFWFRAPVERSLQWSGAKGSPSDKDDERRMNPRSSFKAFLEVIKDKAPKWDDLALGAARSLATFLSEYRVPPPETVPTNVIPRQKSPLEHAEASLAGATAGHCSNTPLPSPSKAVGGELLVDILEPSLPSPPSKGPPLSPSGPLSFTLSSQSSLSTLSSQRRSPEFGILPSKSLSQDRLSMASSSHSAESPLRKALTEAELPRLSVDRQGRVTQWNTRMAHLTGVSEIDALGLSFLDFLLEEGGRDAFSRALASASRGEEVEGIEMRLHVDRRTSRSQDSRLPSPPHFSEVVLCMTASPLRSRGGVQGEGGSLSVGADVIGVVFAGEDKTETKAMEEGMRRTQGDYAAIVHSQCSLIPPIFGVNENGQCLEWNPAMEELTGVQRGQALGQMLVGHIFSGTLHMKGDHRLRLLMGVAQGLAGVAVDRHPFTFRTPQGEEVEVLLTVKTRRDPVSNEVTGCLGFLHCPSSELKQALAIQREAEKLARVSTQKVQYLRDQIRGPLDGLKHIRSQMLESQSLSEEARKALEVGVRCEQQLTRVLGDEAEALEEGFLGLESDEFSLADVVGVVVGIGRQASERRKVDFKWETSSELVNAPTMQGDASRIQQALAGLLTSAIQYTPEGGWVQLRSAIGEQRTGEEVEGVGCEFRVVHSNPEGMPGAVLDCLLGSTSTLTQPSGEGLGLCIARKIVEGVNGDVRYYKMTASSEVVVRIQCHHHLDLEVDVL